MYYFRIGVTAAGEKSQLTLSRLVPDYASTQLPDFGGVFARHFDVLIQSHTALVDLRQHQWNACLNPGESRDTIPNRRL